MTTPRPDLTADERRQQLATLLARGLLRTRQHATAGKLSGIPAAGLELSLETRLSVSRRSGGEGDFATSSLEPWSYAHRSQTISVPMTTIDTLTADWPRFDLVKIDAEGAEGQVWSGMREVRRQFPGVVTVMELHIPRDPAGAERLLHCLADEGVAIQAVEFDGTITPVTVAQILADPQRHWTVWVGG